MTYRFAVLRRAAVAFLALPPVLFSQEPSRFLSSPSDSVEGSASAVVPAAAPLQVEPKALTARWIDLKTFSHAQRYRNAFNQGSAHTFEDGQERMMIEGRFKFDEEGKYAVAIRASSGGYFNWSYADYAGWGEAQRQRKLLLSHSFTQAQNNERHLAGLADPAGNAIIKGTVSTGWHFYMRELYFSATPVKEMTVEFGSLGIEHGLGTEITTFDDDGYVSGERIRIKDPKHLYLDEVGYTNAFFGDLATPNVLDRGGSMIATSNYRQVFGKKQVNRLVAASGEYTWQYGIDTLRQAVLFDMSRSRAIDKVLVESYERLNSYNLQGLTINPDSGFAVTLEKKLGSRVAGDLGYADVDKDYSVYSDHRVFHGLGFSLNGDSYGDGERFFTHVSVKLNPALTAFGFYTHAVGDKVINFNQQNLNAGFNLDFKALANLRRRVF